VQSQGGQVKKLLVVFLLILTIPAFAAADVYIKDKNHTDAISSGDQNQPARDTITEQWIGDGKVALITAAKTTIIDFDKNIEYIINHKTKAYIQASFPLDFNSLLPLGMAGLIQPIQTTATVTPTGRKKTFGTRSCDEYDVVLKMEMVTIKLKIYATTDVPFDIHKYKERVQAGMLKSQMMGLDDASVKELDKIDGWWIATETTSETMGIKGHSTWQVMEVTEKPAPAGIYSVPSGYTRQDKFSLQDLQGQ
jgi:hypothetical protein